ncbi:hypothetical protein QVD17_19502 [Tagetes erecta]|uniref:Replication protein A 70 kDa DNA-binding subunit B/D first OB fold domain-containing protein n=1 Tax=Tagetes erecta TaxID=13708 RepID=A0AAD8KN53_TARER|nr:hypothetical protein QVD17_19502 [Tagetes erecta]
MADVALSFVDDLNSRKNFWNMKARIIRLWKQSFRWDLILVDERGSKIQGIIRNHLTDKFADDIKEDVAILIKNFGVADQSDKHWVINCDRKINFFGCTEVTPIADFAGHPYGFNFVSLTTILDNNVPQESLTVAWVGKLELFKKDGKLVKRIHLDVEDLGGVMLRCTIWGPFAKQCNTFVVANQDSMTEMKTIIIQHGRVKEWGGEITVQNDMFATRIFLDEDITESNDLRRRLFDTQSNIPEDSVSDAVNLNDSSQHIVDSKDCASVTGGSKPTDVEKDSATSPGDKRPIPFNLDEKLSDDASPSRIVKKKLE